MPQVEDEGYDATLNNTIKAPFTKFDIEGHSEQESTSISDGDEYDSPSPEHEQPIKSAGENVNKLPVSTLTTRTTNGITFTNNGDGTYSIKGTATANTTFNPFNGTSIDIPTGKDLTMSFYGLVTGMDAHVWDGNWRDLWVASFDKENISKTGSFTNVSSIICYINVKNGATVDTLIKPKLEPGSTATPWSPYGMGSITEKIVNRNLFDKDTVLRDKTFTSQDVVSTSTGLYISDYIKVTPNTSYYVNENCSVVIGLDKNKVSLGYLKNSSQAGTITTPNNCEWIRVRLYSTSIAMETAISNAMVNLGSTANPYVPHEEQTYSIYIQQPFRSNKDKTVRDCFVKKGDGKLYERHYIARKIFDGTGDWTFSADQGGHSRFDFRIADAVLGSITNNPVQSNRFRTNFAVEDNSIFLSGVEPMISIICDEFRTLDGFKTMLAEKYANGNPVYADYLRKTPLDLPCTEEQIQQIENKPSTYKDFTIIQSQDETPAYLEVSGIYDLNKLINN